MNKHEKLIIILKEYIGSRYKMMDSYVNKYIQEFETTELKLEQLSIKATKQYQKDSKLIGILETKIMQLEKDIEIIKKYGAIVFANGNLSQDLQTFRTAKANILKVGKDNE